MSQYSLKTKLFKFIITLTLLASIPQVINKSQLDGIIIEHCYRLKFYEIKSTLSDEIDRHIACNSRDSKLNPDSIIGLCLTHEFDVVLLLAQAQIESNYGTAGQASRTNSPWNIVGQSYSDPNEAIEPYIILVKYPYLRERPVTVLFESYTNAGGSRYAEDPEYEQKLRTTYYTIKNNTDIHNLFEKLKELHVREYRVFLSEYPIFFCSKLYII